MEEDIFSIIVIEIVGARSEFVGCVSVLSIFEIKLYVIYIYIWNCISI